MAERPEYFVFNGAVLALAKDKPLKAKVGETVRIFFGVGGPNYTSSFHVIGEVFDRAYNLGSFTSPPLTNVQTLSVPPGGGAAVVGFRRVRRCPPWFTSGLDCSSYPQKMGSLADVGPWNWDIRYPPSDCASRL
jgi:hypothetical protein